MKMQIRCTCAVVLHFPQMSCTSVACMCILTCKKRKPHASAELRTNLVWQSKQYHDTVSILCSACSNQECAWAALSKQQHACNDIRDTRIDDIHIDVIRGTQIDDIHIDMAFASSCFLQSYHPSLQEVHYLISSAGWTATHRDL